MSDLGILILHYHTSDVFKQNFNSCVQHNPNATVCCYNPNDLTRHPDLHARHSASPTRSSDVLLQGFWRDKKVNCHKWFVCEWDTYFNTSLEDFFGIAMGLRFVVLDLMRLWTVPWWDWFRETEQFTVKQRQVMTGVVPFAFLIDEELLGKIVEKLPELNGSNGECRFGTAAILAGVVPTVYCPPRARFSWTPVNPARIKAKSIFHSVKYLVEPYQ